jgi:hypothetical protein
VQNLGSIECANAAEMKRRMTIAAVLSAFLLSLGVSEILGCSWAVGYFYQVRNLRGTVVGSKFPVLHSFRWFRQSVTRPQTKLTLYNYCWPCDVRSLEPVKTVLTGTDGKFDFGSLRPSHYYLRIDDGKGELSDWFEVEVKGPPSPKESVMIDISPIRPDCSGGHEFIIRAN